MEKDSEEQRKKVNAEKVEKIASEALKENPKPYMFTLEELRVKKDHSIRFAVVIIVGIVLVILTLGGVVGPICNSEVFEDYWPRVLPIISGAIFGLIGFIVGEKVESSKRN